MATLAAPIRVICVSTRATERLETATISSICGHSDWTRSAPSSAEAHTALGGLLEATEELTGDDAGSAIDEIRKARALSSDSASALDLARVELRLLVKGGEWAAVATLADSLFAGQHGGFALLDDARTAFLV